MYKILGELKSGMSIHSKFIVYEGVDGDEVPQYFYNSALKQYKYNIIIRIKVYLSLHLWIIKYCSYSQGFIV